jgi:hypothetical protein
MCKQMKAVTALPALVVMLELYLLARGILAA